MNGQRPLSQRLLQAKNHVCSLHLRLTAIVLAELTRLGGLDPLLVQQVSRGLDPLLVHAMCANMHVAACMVNVRGRHLFNRMDPLVR